MTSEKGIRCKLGTDLPHLRYMRVIKHMFSLGIHVLAVLLSFEIFLRLFVYGPGPNYVFDPDLGYRYGTGTEIFNGIEGFGTIHYVNDGEVATPYSSGESILVMGDSHTQAIQVDDINNFVSIAEEILQGEGYSVDLHNYGGAGTRIPDYIYMSSDVKQRYHPEILVIQLSIDDFFGNAFDASQPSYFSVATDGSLVLNHNIPVRKHITFVESINRYSALTNFSYERLYRIVYKTANQKGNTKNDRDAARSQPQEIASDMIKMQLQALSDAYPDIPIVAIVLPFTPRIHNSDVLFQEEDYKILTQTIQSLDGYYLLNPLPSFNKLVSEGKFPRGFQNTTPGNGHLNMSGHQIVGTLLASLLREIIR